MVARLQKLGKHWYAFIVDEALGEVYHVRMPDGWEPVTADEVKLVVPPTEH